MTNFLMSVHGPAELGEFGSYGSKEEFEAALATTNDFNDKLRAEGFWVFAGGLAQAADATVVDGQGDKPVITDGPYTETKEYLAGFWLIEAPSSEVALELAAEASKACGGPVEVRAFDGLG